AVVHRSIEVLSIRQLQGPILHISMPEDQDLRAAALGVFVPVVTLGEIGESVLKRMIGRRFVIRVRFFASRWIVVPGDYSSVLRLGASFFGALADILVCGGVAGHGRHLFVSVAN